MNLIGWIDRVDDRLNPIVVKELRQAVKSRLISAMLLLFLGVQMAFLTVFLAFREPGAGPEGLGLGNQVFAVLQTILLGTCMVLIPAYTCFRMQSERSDTNVDLLFISSLRPRSIIAGKFFSAQILAMLVFSCCAPFITFSYLMRGLDIPSILMVLGIDLLAVILSTQFALFLSVLPTSRVFRTFLFFFAFLVLCGAFADLVTMTTYMTRQGVFTEFDFEAWAAIGVTTLAVLLSTGLLFCWSVALISPASANRALLGRVFLVGMWLVLGAACMGITWRFWALRGGVGPELVMVWAGCSIILFCLQFLISINERDSWGPRVTRSIPRSRILRPIAFLFYSGAGGGMILSVICIFLTLLATWQWTQIFFISLPSIAGAGAHDPFERARLGFAAIALFTFCYGTSAVLLRAYLLRARVRPGLTWLVGLILVALGMLIPWIAAYVFDSRSVNSYFYNGTPWWLFGNPFGALARIESDFRFQTPFTIGCFAFLITWALVLTALAVPWLGRQLALFKPLAVRARERTPAKAELVPERVPAQAVQSR